MKKEAVEGQGSPIAVFPTGPVTEDLMLHYSVPEEGDLFFSGRKARVRQEE